MIKEWIDKQKAKTALMKVFKTSDISLDYSYGQSKGKIYPKIRSVRFKDSAVTYTFSLPIGLDPKEIKQKEYCFYQVFGKNIELKGDTKYYTLRVFAAVLPSVLEYDYEACVPHFKGMALPIVAGMDLNGNLVVFDMVKHPHLLIAGETGSGKSTQLRSIISTLIQALPPERLKLYLCDLKRSEFHIFRNIEHVEDVFITPKEIIPMLQLIKLEMEKRGDLLDHHELSHIDDLPKPPPYIVLAIDEVAMLKKEKKLMEIVEDISAIGRALGVFLILSMQRPDRDVLDGKLKNNLTVRMGFRCADLINSRIIGTPGSEKLEIDGRLLLKIPIFKETKELQAPFLALTGAKKVLETYKIAKKAKPLKTDSDTSSEVVLDATENEDGIFEVLD